MNSPEPFIPMFPELPCSFSQLDPTATAAQFKLACPPLLISSVCIALVPACTLKVSDVGLTTSFAGEGSTVNCRSALREPRFSLAWIVCSPGDQNVCATTSAANEPVTPTGTEEFEEVRLAECPRDNRTSAFMAGSCPAWSSILVCS